MRNLKTTSPKTLFLRLFIVCVFSVFFIASFSYSQDSKTPNTNINQQNQQSVEEKKDSEAKLNEQIIELKKQLAELTQKIGDNKQASYDSFLNSLNVYMAVFGIIILMGGIWGFIDISKKVNESKTENATLCKENKGEITILKTDLLQRVIEIKTDNTTILDRSEKHVGERILALEKRITEFKKEQKESFERFEKEANKKMDEGLNSDYQSAIQKIAESSFVPQINELSEQVAELKNTFENFQNHQNITDISTTIPEINQFDIESDKKPSKEKNAFDEQ